MTAASVVCLFIGTPDACAHDLVECLRERQRLNDLAVMQECSSRLRDGGLVKSPEWSEFLARYGSEPEFVPHTVNYVNTPVDPRTADDTARTIIDALEQAEKHKLIFMVRLQCGRVVSKDIAAIATVMESIHQNEVPFSVIVYEIGTLQRVDVMVTGEVSKKVEEAMKYTKYKPNSVLFVPEALRRSEVKREDICPMRGVAEFIKSKTPTVQICPTCVKAMDMATFETTLKALRKRQRCLPTGEISEMRVGASVHKFESSASAEVVFLTLIEALSCMDAEFTCLPNWIIDGHALISAEQVFFRIYIFRSTVTNAIEALFSSPVLPMCQKELKFTELISRVLEYCASVDTGIFAKARRPVGPYYAAPGERTSCTMRPNDLSLILSAARSSYQVERLQAAMWLKDACRDEVNRRTLLALFKEELAGVLCELLRDIDQTTVRFAVYAIKKFAESPADLNELALPQLNRKLKSIMALSSESTTRKLAWQLYAATADGLGD